MEEKYPDIFLRGVSTADFMTEEGYAMAGAFQFDNSPRGDGFCELSVNWHDDENAIYTLLNQHKPGKTDKQFKAGYCIIELKNLCLMLNTYISANLFSYERRPIEGNEENDYQENPYHGNLLMKHSINKHLQKNIQHSLATLAGSVVLREK